MTTYDSVEEILEYEGLTMGRGVTLVHADVFEGPQVVTTVIYDVEPYELDVADLGKYHQRQRRVATYVDGVPKYTTIVHGEFEEVGP